MERRKALAAASAATLVLGSSIVAVASATGASFLGFGGDSKHGATYVATGAGGSSRGVMVKTRNVYDRYVIATGNGATGAEASGNVAASSPALGANPDSTPPTEPGADGDGDAATPTSRPKSSSPAQHTTSPTTPTTDPRSPNPAVDPTTVPPSPTTTIPATTPTTWPPGVPRDWPKDVAIPPMPPGCEQPQLDLVVVGGVRKGVWNCQD